MASLAAERPTLVAVLASEDACDAAMEAPGVLPCRVAPREVMLLGEAGPPALEGVVALDPGAVVEDVSDGWACIVLEGEGSRDAFSRLSELELPDEGFVQGEVARVAVRVVASGDRITLMTPAMWADHLDERIRADCPEVWS